MCRIRRAPALASFALASIGLAACNSPSVVLVDLRSPAPDLHAAPDLAAAQDLAEPPGPMDLAAADDLALPPDLTAPRDLAPGAFHATLGGIWMVGFSGGLDHFTFIRFNVANPNGGAADFVEASGRPGWVGFWQGCSGAGQWALAQKPDTISLKFPAKCNMADISFTFQNVQVPMGGFPGGALLEATFAPSPPAPPVGYKYPAKQCDAQFTSCTLP